MEGKGRRAKRMKRGEEGAVGVKGREGQGEGKGRTKRRKVGSRWSSRGGTG